MSWGNGLTLIRWNPQTFRHGDKVIPSVPQTVDRGGDDLLPVPRMPYISSSSRNVNFVRWSRRMECVWNENVHGRLVCLVVQREDTGGMAVDEVLVCGYGLLGGWPCRVSRAVWDGIKESGNQGGSLGGRGRQGNKRGGEKKKNTVRRRLWHIAKPKKSALKVPQNDCQENKSALNPIS